MMPILSETRFVRQPAALPTLLRLAPPTLMALYGPLALLAANLGVVEPSSAARSLVVSALFGILVTLAALAFLRKQEAAVVQKGGLRWGK
jgi:Zn-dependent protease with chaperone function